MLFSLYYLNRLVVRSTGRWHFLCTHHVSVYFFMCLFTAWIKQHNRLSYSVT